ncbi:hypothetical protein ACFVAD_08050 [Sutcliffiella sp. NPDC057660]
MKKFAVVILLGVLFLSQSEWSPFVTDYSTHVAAHKGKNSPNDPTLPSED